MAVQLPDDFHLERYFSKYEFKVKYPLCCSDAEPLMMDELLEMADKECKALWSSLKLGYTETLGHPLLRTAIAKLQGLQVDNILTVIPSEGIYVGLRCMVAHLQRLHPSTTIHAITAFPEYQSLHENLKILGCHVDHWNAQLTKTGWNFDLNHLAQIATNETKILVVNFPHNPTGFVPTLDEWNKIISFCSEREIYLFSDEMYRYTNNDGLGALPSAATIYKNSISLSGLSKSFAMAGLRAGWVCTRNEELMQLMIKYKDYTTICACAPGEILALIGVRNALDIVRKHTLPIIQRNKALLADFFAKHVDIFDWFQPRAGTVGLLKLKGWLLTVGTGGATGFCHELVEEVGVLLLPSSLLEYDDSYVRFSFCRRNLPDALEQLEKFIQKYRPK